MENINQIERIGIMELSENEMQNTKGGFWFQLIKNILSPIELGTGDTTLGLEEKKLSGSIPDNIPFEPAPAPCDNV